MDPYTGYRTRQRGAELVVTLISNDEQQDHISSVPLPLSLESKIIFPHSTEPRSGTSICGFRL